MGDTERQLRWALIYCIVVALMSTDTRHWWTLIGGTAGATLIIRAH
ncbi:unnamed protein product [Staurois parvus]|uniref:Uncharacterized protein n=1 Tax=Staurois parvus TaxID=386267 RepID=A0ABN9CMX3_9NEOB|nr:unnamed protein product [Staurois parvus]